MAESSSTRSPSPPLTQKEALGRALLKRKSIFGIFMNNRNDYWNTHVEPGRPITHWDMLLAELKWLEADFKCEQATKIYNAWVMAHACQRWWIEHRLPPLQTKRVLELKAEGIPTRKARPSHKHFK